MRGVQEHKTDTTGLEIILSYQVMLVNRQRFHHTRRFPEDLTRCQFDGDDMPGKVIHIPGPALQIGDSAGKRRRNRCTGIAEMYSRPRPSLGPASVPVETICS